MEMAALILIVAIGIQIPLGLFVEIHRRRIGIEEDYGLYIIIAPVAGLFIFLYYWKNRAELAGKNGEKTLSDS